MVMISSRFDVLMRINASGSPWANGISIPMHRIASWANAAVSRASAMPPSIVRG